MSRIISYLKRLKYSKILFIALRDLIFTYCNISYAPYPKIYGSSRILLFIVSFNIKHIYGDRYIDCNSDEVILVCVMKNGEEYIKTFIEHHLSLGVKHIVFLDNDSNDNSIKIACSYKEVTVLHTKLPFRTYNKYLKFYLYKRFSNNCWCLRMDIDELFDYPFSDRINLKLLVTYMNRNSYNCLLAHMLDMFSDKSLDTLEKCGELDIKEEYRFYDFSDFKKKPLDGPFNLSDKNLHMYQSGGIRATVFGRITGSMTRYPLIFLSKDFNIQDIRIQKVLNGAKIADFTAVVLHYKFTKSILYQCVKAIEERNYAHDSRKYKQFYEVLVRNPKINLKQEAKNPREFNQVNELVDNDFLYVSEAFTQFATRNHS